MHSSPRIFFITGLFLSGIFTTSFAQTNSAEAFKQHIQILADDKLEGRATGSDGEAKASTYIISVMMEYGLKPAGENGTYLQSFDARSGKLLGANNYIQAGEKYVSGDNIYPHPMSANGKVTGDIVAAGFGISAAALNYDDFASINVRDKIALIKMSSPDGTHPHSKYIEYNDERKKIQTAAAKGAKAVIFYNEDVNYTLPDNKYKRNVTAEQIPVFITDAETAKKLIAYGKPVTIETELTDDVRTGHNVLGYIDNKAANTIVIGAHYDHLGHGEIEGSLYRGAPAIHNGADDNASGVAMILELAKRLQKSDYKNNNYLFIAFSGEEMGLFGSKAFVSSALLNNYSINYMLNYDMVGRLDTSNTLIINGAGTSPSWTELNSVIPAGLKITTTESGIGPSDQTSFYLKDIPVLHFFTGSHADYHKPSDDEALINYAGMLDVEKMSVDLIGSLNDDGRITFTKTKDSNNENTPRFTVTMGIVPDYAYSGKGMRVDGVSDGKPAQKAGVMAGDIIVQLGAFEVTDMMGYMQSLSKFAKGDTTTVIVLRNNERIELPVQF